MSASSMPAHRFSLARSARLPGVEIERGFHGGAPAAWQLVPMMQIAHLRSGSVWICCGDECARMEAGDVIVSAPGFHPRVQQRLSVSAETLKAFVSPRLFSEEMARRGAPAVAGLDVRIVRAERLAPALDHLCATIEDDRDAFELHRAFADLLDQLVHAMSFSCAEPLRTRPPRPEIEAARRTLHERFADTVSLDQLAEQVGLSKFHLLRLFREEVGTTPHAYQLHLRIARAREMLDRGVSAAEVALACGFADQAHFTRCFKSIVGFTPGAFARLG